MRSDGCTYGQSSNSRRLTSAPAKIVSGDKSSRREAAAKVSTATPMIVISMGSLTGTIWRPTIEVIPVVGL
jgi:hypothetical protein